MIWLYWKIKMNKEEIDILLTEFLIFYTKSIENMVKLNGISMDSNAMNVMSQSLNTHKEKFIELKVGDK